MRWVGCWVVGGRLTIFIFVNCKPKFQTFSLSCYAVQMSLGFWRQQRKEKEEFCLSCDKMKNIILLHEGGWVNKSYCLWFTKRKIFLRLLPILNDNTEKKTHRKKRSKYDFLTSSKLGGNFWASTHRKKAQRDT